MTSRHTDDSQERAASRSDFSERSGRRIEKGEGGPQHRKPRRHRTRKDPFASVWQPELVPMLEAHPDLKAITLLEYLPPVSGAIHDITYWHYLVSVGFEGRKTMRAVSRADPDRVSVLFPDPGFEPSYAERTKKDNQVLFDQYRIPPSQTICAPAVLYSMPEEHKVVEIEPADKFWRFDITCLTAPS